MPPHPAAIDAAQLSKECDVHFVRRSGPGGQHRNKVSTAVVLTHRPSGIQGEAAERRSQAENRTVALFRLRINLALKQRTIWQTASPLWQSRCQGGRINVSDTHDDWPAMLAEALDAVAVAEFDPKRAAESLACSVSQLLKLLKKEPRAMLELNEQRQRRGMHALV